MGAKSDRRSPGIPREEMSFQTKGGHLMQGAQWCDGSTLHVMWAGLLSEEAEAASRSLVTGRDKERGRKHRWKILLGH